MLTMNANCFALRATSAVRSVPLQWLAEVSATSAPQLNAASPMRISSVATITESRSFARMHRSHTRRKRALPAIRCNGFPGKRVELQRAGIMPTALFMDRNGLADFVRRVADLNLLGTADHHHFAFKMI